MSNLCNKYIVLLNYYENIISNLRSKNNFSNTDPLYNSIQLKRAKQKQLEILSYLRQIESEDWNESS